MGTAGRFNLSAALESWEGEVSVSGALTSQDVEILRSNLLDSVENLKLHGLSEEEAFSVSLHRLGKSFDWDGDFKKVNQVLIQVKKLIILSTGILLYFFSFYLILVISKLITCISVLLKNEPQNTTSITNIVLGIAILSIFFLFINLLTKEYRIYRLLGFIRFKPKHAIYILISTIVLAIADRCFTPFLSMFFKKGLVSLSVLDTYIWFYYLYPLLICFGYIVLYVKFFRKL